MIILLIGISLIIQSDDNSGVQNFFLINNLSSFRPTSCWHTSLPVQSSTLEIMKFFLPSGRMCDYVAQCVHVLVTIMLKNAKSLRTSAQRDRQTGKQMLGVIQIDLLNLTCMCMFCNRSLTQNYFIHLGTIKTFFIDLKHLQSRQICKR